VNAIDTELVENMLYSNSQRIPLEDSDTDDEFVPMTCPEADAPGGAQAEVLWVKARRTHNPNVTQRKMLPA
jgi:hypothetical protein